MVDVKENPVTDSNFWKDASLVMRYEFKATINQYLASTPDTVKTRTLDDLIVFNEEHADIELALFDQSIWNKAATLGDLTTPAYILARNRVQVAMRDAGIDALLDAYNVEILIALSGPRRYASRHSERRSKFFLRGSRLDGCHSRLSPRHGADGYGARHTIRHQLHRRQGL